MNIEKSKNQKFYELSPKHSGGSLESHILSKGRILVGRADSCDYIIKNNLISSVHAVLEVNNGKVKVFDMNSKNGTFVNGSKVVVSDIKVGDEIAFGDFVFSLEEYVKSKSTSMPPILDVLEPEQGRASVFEDNSNQLPQAPEDKIQAEPVTKVADSSKPQKSVALGLDVRADETEYIFEDSDDIYPIFNYDVSKQAVEVIILFNDRVFCADYIPDKNARYSLVGSNPSKNELEFPYLGAKEKLDLLEVSNGDIVVNNLVGYETIYLSDSLESDKAPANINLKHNDILHFKKDNLEIYLRRVDAPPKVSTPPFFRRDPEVKKFIALCLLFVFLPLAALNFFHVDEELDKEKDPERIATILYKQVLKKKLTKAVEKEKTPKKERKKEPKKVAVKKPQPSKSSASQKNSNTSNNKKTGSKSAKKVVQTKKVNKPRPKSSVPSANTAAASSNRTKTANTRKSVTNSANKGSVDVYKSFDFKSTVSSLVARGGSINGAKSVAQANSNAIGGAAVGGGVATNLRKADVGSEVGSLTGAATGKLAESKGAEGLSAKKGIYTASIPSETVVVGGMDPDVIRRILKEHIPQFRYCYQKVLDKNANANVSGVVSMLFSIGASGHVTKAVATSRSALPSHVRGCIARVLKGIQFPPPEGGGIVEVNQPFNLYPKRL